MNKSIWEEFNNDLEIKDSKSDLNNKKYDVVIIGGDITGVSVAYYLRNTNRKVLLIDKGEIGGDISARTKAKITYLQKTIYQDLVNYWDKKTAYEYYSSQKDAINEIKDIVDKENKGIKRIEREYKILSNFKCRVDFVNSRKCLMGIKIYDS